jgi:hypothetical protein
MTGIYLVFAFLIWLLLLYGIVVVVTIMLPKRWWRALIRVLLFIGLLPFPLVDEIFGKAQFEQLCKENSTIQVDRAKAVGKTVYLADLADSEIKGTWVRVVSKPWRYVDVKTGETVVSYNTLQAVGGRFIRALGISEGDVPLTFKSTCVPSNRPAAAKAFRELGINYIERPASKSEK